jgi:hypothetical protein
VKHLLKHLRYLEVTSYPWISLLEKRRENILTPKEWEGSYAYKILHLSMVVRSLLFLKSRRKNALYLPPCEIHMFRFTIAFASCLMMGKVRGWGHSQNAGLDLAIAFSLALNLGNGPILGLYTDLGASPMKVMRSCIRSLWFLRACF